MKHKHLLVFILLINIFSIKPSFSQGDQDGLSAWYPFDGNAKDYSGNGIDGEVAGATPAPNRFGEADKAYFFNGVTDNINIGNSPLLTRYNTDFSISAWINLSSYSSSYGSSIVSNRNDGYGGSIFCIQGQWASVGKISFVIKGGGEAVVAASSYPINLNTWYHVAVSFKYYGSNSNLINIYINGALTCSQSISSIVDPGNMATSIGYEPYINPPAPSPYHFHGSMDELKIYNRVLNASEINESYLGVASYKTRSSGDWNSFQTWQINIGDGFKNASEGQIPSAANSVYIEAGHTITLTDNASCKDLHLNTTADVVRLDTKEHVLEVWGKLRLYSGSSPGTNSTTSGIPGWISTGTNGRIRLKGTENRIITAKDEFTDHENLKGWTLECSLNDSAIGTINSNFRAGNVIITSGKLEVKSKNFKVSK